MCIETDVLIIGCGVAGAAAALRVAQSGSFNVLVITRPASPDESNTRYAQGGIVSRGPNDSTDLLVQDVLAAGAGCCLPAAVRLLAEEGPALVQRVLIEEAGVVFDQDANGAWSYTREGGHSARRILHVGDATGR
ncbi:MAG: FAD-dependent oxidoreductase, partial [Candidatus Hydrogenedentes bacterium]|nr:FAD-dependent oxidoreductase [Candidatus Hydrogenedentota bacterium]